MSKQLRGCFYSGLGLLLLISGAVQAGEYRVMLVPADQAPQSPPSHGGELSAASADSTAVAFSLRPSNLLQGSKNYFVSSTVLTVYVYDAATGYLVPNADLWLTPPKARANSGGHDHDDANRPAGSFSVLRGNTGVTGLEFQTTYTAPEVSGIVDTYANCTAPGGFVCFPDQNLAIGIEIPGLHELQPAFYYDLVGSYGMPGVNSMHIKNHYGTASFTAKLAAVGALYFLKYENQPNNKLAFNDISLEKGGLFDIANNWAPDHREHRIGISGDVDIKRVPGTRREELRRLLKLSEILGTTYPHPSHWHVREYGSSQ